MLFEFFQLIKCFFAIFCLKYGLVKAIVYGMDTVFRTSEMPFPGFKFQKFSGGLTLNPPSYPARRILLQSDFKLDSPLQLTSYR